MIAIPTGVRIMLATRPVDFRRGAHSLAAQAAASLGQDPFNGALIVFRAKRADRVENGDVVAAQSVRDVKVSCEKRL